MHHIILNEIFTCPKCNKTDQGACVQVLDFIVCTDCFYEKYELELVPKIKEMIIEYFHNS